MGVGVKRGVAGAGTVVVAGAVNVATGMLTQSWDLAWGVAAVVLVVVGAGLQWWLTVRASPRVSVPGDAAMGAAGSIRDASTKVTRPAGSGSSGAGMTAAGDGVQVSGLGALGAGGDIERARTEVGDGDGDGGTAAP